MVFFIVVSAICSVVAESAQFRIFPLFGKKRVMSVRVSVTRKSPMEGKENGDQIRLRRRNITRTRLLTQFLIDGALGDPIVRPAGFPEEVPDISELVLSDGHVVLALSRDHRFLKVLEHVIVPPLRLTEAGMTKATVLQEIEFGARWIEPLSQIRTNHRHRFEFEFLCGSRITLLFTSLSFLPL